MLRAIYSQPIWLVLAEICLAVAVWAFARERLTGQWWYGINGAVLLVAVGLIFYATVAGREPGQHEVILKPFQSFLDARHQPEMYRTMLMNVLLFLPLGLAMSNVLAAQWSVWVRITLTVLAGCFLSCLVEWLQYTYGLGRTEADDVICNTFGTLVGSMSLLIPIGKIKTK